VAVFLVNVTAEFPINEIFELSEEYTAPPNEALFAVNVTVDFSSNKMVELSIEYIAP